MAVGNAHGPQPSPPCSPNLPRCPSFPPSPAATIFKGSYGCQQPHFDVFSPELGKKSCSDNRLQPHQEKFTCIYVHLPHRRKTSSLPPNTGADVLCLPKPWENVCPAAKPYRDGQDKGGPCFRWALLRDTEVQYQNTPEEGMHPSTNNTWQSNKGMTGHPFP